MISSSQSLQFGWQATVPQSGGTVTYDTVPYSGSVPTVTDTGAGAWLVYIPYTALYTLYANVDTSTGAISQNATTDGFSSP